MSIDVLIVGRLVADPVRRTGASGKPFTTARMGAATDGGESVLCSVIAFGTAGEQLAALTKGDTLAIAGRATPKAWTDREGALKAGMDVVAEQVLSVYHLRKRRAALGGDEGNEAAPRERRARRAARAGSRGGHGDDAHDVDEWLSAGA